MCFGNVSAVDEFYFNFIVVRLQNRYPLSLALFYVIIIFNSKMITGHKKIFTVVSSF